MIQTIYKAVFECEEMYFYHIQFLVPVPPFQILRLFFRSNSIHFRYIFCYNFCSLKVEKFRHFVYKVFNNLSTLFSTVQYCSILHSHSTHILPTFYTHILRLSITYYTPFTHTTITIYTLHKHIIFTFSTHFIICNLPYIHHYS